MSANDSQKETLQKAHSLHTGLLPGNEKLGDQNFLESRNIAEIAILALKEIDVSELSSLPESYISEVTQVSQRLISTFDSIGAFNLDRKGLVEERRRLISEIEETTKSAVSGLSHVRQFIEFDRRRRRAPTELDVKKLEWDDSRDKFNSAALSLINQINEESGKAKNVLSEAEALLVTAEARVEQATAFLIQENVKHQARYFKKESVYHEKRALHWFCATCVFAFCAGAFLIFTPFLVYLIPSLHIGNAYDAIQLGLSKTLILAVLTYMLILCSKNFMSHKHNAIVNKHRQNALETYRSLADAASPEQRDIVLSHAASCIFSPQETGYTKSATQTNITGLSETIPRLLHPNQ